MEFKKKTIIWEDNNEPPKNYIWVKSDGNAYEFNHTTRQWEKIMSSNESGSGSNSDIFFAPADIQPKYFANNGDTEPRDIKNYTPGNYTVFLYNKEDVISLGAYEEDLNNLDYITIPEAFDDFYGDNNNGYFIRKSVFSEKIILYEFNKNSSNATIYNNNRDGYLYKISDNVFLILQSSGRIDPAD